MNVKIQNIEPKDDDTIIIEDFDGELSIIISPLASLKSINLISPSSPKRASKIDISSTQDINKIVISGQKFDIPLTSIKSTGNISYVWCPVDGMYICTGQNYGKQVPVTKKSHAKLAIGLLSFVAGSFFTEAIFLWLHL